MLYAYPEIGRFGLAHGMMAWARSTVWAEETGARTVAPIWLRPRIGPYLRNERDKRNYWLLFHAGGQVSGLERALVLATADRFEAGHGWPERPLPSKRRQVMIFRNRVQGNEENFDQIVDHGPLLRERLLRMTRQRYHPAQVPRRSIALHVRMGDFSPPTDRPDAPATNRRLPLNWFADRLHALRDGLGEVVPAIVYSDGTDAELAPLLSLSSISRSPRQASITDLLSMGQSAAVISSGSGFSLWGAFLGGAARLCHPGQSLAVAYRNPAMQIESAFQEQISAEFLEMVRNRLAY